MGHVTLSNPRGAGRKPAVERHAGVIVETEKKLAEHLPEVADEILRLALGSAPERCPTHDEVLACPYEDEETGEICGQESQARRANEKMLVYVFNRIAGVPTVAGEKQVNMEFVRELARHVGEVFRAVNQLPTPEERSHEFAVGLSQMFLQFGKE